MHDSSYAVLYSSGFVPTRIFVLLEQSAQPHIDDVLKKISDAIKKLHKTLGDMDESSEGGPKKEQS